MSDAIPVLDPAPAAAPARRYGPRKGFKRGRAEMKSPAPQARAAVPEQPQNSVREADSAEKVTRKSRGERQVGGYDIPMKFRKSGWDYQWITLTVINEPRDDATSAQRDGGWRPVSPDDMPELCPPGYAGRTIDVRGMRLFMRPMHLTQEARREDHAAAIQQVADRMGHRGAISDLSEVRGITPRVESLIVEGEVGVYAERK